MIRPEDMRSHHTGHSTVPASGQALYRLGRSLHDQGRREAAALCYRKALSLDPTLAEAYNDLGTLAQEAGRLQEAEICYRSALISDPRFSEACYNLGNTYKELKDWRRAERYCRKALTLNPQLTEAWFVLGVVCHEENKTEEAIACWLKVLESKPDHLQAHLNLASVYYTGKRYAEAEIFYKKSLLLNPRQAVPWLGLGKIKEDQGEEETAGTFYRQALEIDPSLPEAYIRLGNLALRQGDTEQALGCYKKAVRLCPDNFEYFGHLGNAYQQKGELEKATTCFQKAIQLKPDYHPAYNNLGLILHTQGRLEESLKMYQKAIAFKPDSPELLVNLGNLYKEQGKTSTSIELLKKAIADHPDFPWAHWNLALVLLATGNFEEGWREYEYRLRIDESIFRKELPFPLWNGEEILGKKILIHQEQGLGDTIQFIRYVPLIRNRGGRVVLQCQKELIPLFSSMGEFETIISFGEEPPPCDYRCPLLSLPRIFRTDLAAIPARIPYLFPDSKKIEAWGKIMKGEGKRFRVGLVWAGRPEHAHDRNRSIALDRFLPILYMTEISWYSLQKGKAASQVRALPSHVELIDHTEALQDFSDTAALIEHLDLVISVDTAVAHLAGARGKPVWVLLHYSPDWRWLLDREDTPWYPTMRLFRQDRYGDWDGVIQRVAEELRRKFF